MHRHHQTVPLRFSVPLSVALAVVHAAAQADPLPYAPPSDVGMAADQLRHIDPFIHAAIDEGKLPGCVVLIGRAGRVVFHQAYGHRQLEPVPVPMTVDTLFDLASLTKPIATATSVMVLVERGLVRLRDPVADHLPEFATNGKEQITVEQLLTHHGGLIPDNPLADYESGTEAAWKNIFQLSPQIEPGTQFKYTDVGYLVLAEMVRRITGDNIHEFSQQNIFRPLAMRETGYLPSADRRERAAPTEMEDGRWLRGEVHDPRARLLGGVAGHAGLFSTAADLAIYAQTMLDGGTHDGSTILAPATVQEMTRARDLAGNMRGLGWDMRSAYSRNRGELFSPHAFGHGGFTGTVLWIDPQLDLFFIFLSNRLHPDGEGSVNDLAGRIGTMAAAAIRPKSRGQPAASGTVMTGIDVLAGNKFRSLAGCRVGLITNHTGVDLRGRRTADLLHRAESVELVSLFSPEHGIAGLLDQSSIADASDPVTGVPIYSLYRDTRRPQPEQLAGLDALVFDIQDIGTRFYTYVSTMGLAMETAAEAGLRFVVLDRPNPIGGRIFAGPMLDPGRESFVGYHSLPVRHGMTVGELARMFRDELDLNLELQIIPVTNWRRDQLWDATGLVWVNPSPNMRSLTAAVLYPGIGLLETTNVSVGRGTDTPFEVLGAPWMDGRELAAALNARELPGVRFVPLCFTPESSKHAQVECHGVNIVVTHRPVFQSVRTGLVIASELRRLYPDSWDTAHLMRLLGNRATHDALVLGADLQEVQRRSDGDLREFASRRAKYLLYE